MRIIFKLELLIGKVFSNGNSVVEKNIWMLKIRGGIYIGVKALNEDGNGSSTQVEELSMA